MNIIQNSYWMIPKAREVFEDVQRALYYFDTVDYTDTRTVINVDYDGAVILQRAVAEYLIKHARKERENA